MHCSGNPVVNLSCSDDRSTSPNPIAVDYRTAQALSAAHAHGVIHRDLQASNILINQRGEPVVVNFGLVTLWRYDLAKDQTILIEIELRSVFSQVIDGHEYQDPEIGATTKDLERQTADFRGEVSRVNE